MNIQSIAYSAVYFITAALLFACTSKEVVENQGHTASALDTPLTRQGTPAEFDRPSCGAFDSSGRLAVCEGAERQLLVFDSLGQYQYTFGRRGTGPGEFHTISGVHFDKAGNLLVWDGGRRKMVAIDTNGKLVEDKQMARISGWIPRYLGQSIEGRFVFMERTYFIPRRGQPTGVMRNWTKLLAYDTAAKQLDVLDSIVHSESFAWGSGFSQITFGMPFQATGDAIVAGDRLVMGFTRDSVLFARSMHSDRVDTIQLLAAAYPISNDVWERRWDTSVARTSREFRDRKIAAKGAVPRAQFHPRFVSLLATSRGTIAAYVPTDSNQITYEIRCVEVEMGDRCPSVRTVPGEVVLAIGSGVAAVAIEQEDGTWRVVLRAASNEVTSEQTPTSTPTH